MESRVQKALERKQNGYNCAQSVVCSYCDLLGIDEKTAFKISEGFGAGMGGMQLTCGALTGAFMLLGMLNSSANLEKPNSKQATNALVREAAKKFQDKNGSITCSELKGIKTGKVLRTCPGCIEDSCKIIEEFLNVSDANLGDDVLKILG